ncbi:hypothetical protein [Georgenia muralis]|uniref:Capsular polysaccharide biosynthesis protein n=1 Tax=Georgenia muralis TaxID=154117 RepID=A0A3N4ZJS2_9MICO|nr:hypothetical protein [Georgenia muralis]RPF26078.1 hypothetical protein EDD32_0502 [Georgenia muralis]
MVIADLWRSVRRGWYVVVAGVVCTTLAGFYVLEHDGVYYSRVDVILMAPSSALYPNSLATTSGDLIQTAGIVETVLNGTDQPRKLAETSATLVGRGELRGSLVVLPDTGGQWAPNFNRQVLDVQVVGPTEESVRAEQARVLGRIDEILEEIQDETGVAAVNRITTEVAVDPPTVHHLTGEPRRALVMTALLGGGLTLGAVLLVGPRPRASRRGRQERAGVSVGAG